MSPITGAAMNPICILVLFLPRDALIQLVIMPARRQCTSLAVARLPIPHSMISGLLT